MVHRAKSGHVGGSPGAADLLVALYHAILRVDPQRPEWAERDRFVLSKGHCSPVLYATLAQRGFFPTANLATFRRPGSHLQGHPYQPKTPGVDASTGTLGRGLSTACGMALAGRLRGDTHRVYVLCGDGEQQEGQIWEAAMFASKYALANLVAFTDRNRLQTDGDTEKVMPLEPLADKWRAFGWERGLQARVLHYPTIKPLHRTPLVAAARETAGIVTAEEHSIIGGLGEAVAAELCDGGDAAVVRRIGLRDTFGESGHAGELMDKYGLRARDIVREALAVIAMQNRGPVST
jgi:transketolase N-terminal domain/subunit